MKIEKERSQVFNETSKLREESVRYQQLAAEIESNKQIIEKKYQSVLEDNGMQYAMKSTAC